VSGAAREIRRFQVALKALIFDKGRVLALRERGGPGFWEFPGGRIEVGEEERPQVDVLRRELLEELGPAFVCTIGAPLVTWTRPMLMQPGEWGLLVGFECRDARGAIELSDEHSEHAWVDRASARALTFAPGYAAALERVWPLLEARSSP
jgi:8-oxo-dGTP diphosphatase